MTKAHPFTFTPAFALQADCVDVRVDVTHDTATGAFLNVTFHDKRLDQMVTIPANVFDMMVEAVNAKKEF